MFPSFAQEFHLDNTQLLLITGVCILAFAYANFLIVPCSNIFGRRPTYFVFTLISIAALIWQARATSYASLIVARVVNGAGAATNETMAIQVIADMLFLHERGLWTMAYFTSTSLGAYLGPVISGNITERFGWRSFFWLSVALNSFNFITILLCYPETRYRRDTQLTQETSPISVSTPIPDDEKITKPSTTTPLPPPHPPTPSPGTGFPSKTQFHLWQIPDPQWKRFLLRDCLTPVRVCIYPIIFWAGLAVSGSSNLVLFWNLTESSVLGAPPYNFSASAVGYSNFAFAVGVLVGLVTAGPWSDWVVLKATGRNNGVYEAEMRLFALLPCLVLVVVSTVVGAFAMERRWDWPVILVVGYALCGICGAAIGSISVAYAVDCYKPISGEIMTVVTVIKNTCGFGMSFWLPSLAARTRGYFTPAMVQLALTVGPLVLAGPMYFWGKRFRVWTRNSSVHSYEM
ncbi:MFS transporter [Aspergillus heteromorphus CBS 117.55]|uniref:MFS transporter n=1 Tax=Aspergillus heteromorphus CBS 117.55 TaxID=1448321 RepID=A0A317WDQ1_9EURO|nr:MFS transporter [Aspergillus heteromorphus CBS 117.55]PWY83352.1 MFS transporter [Aspergillus heteromorphus CBS 117.55]